MAIVTITNGKMSKDDGRVNTLGYNITRHKYLGNYLYDTVTVDTAKYKALWINIINHETRIWYLDLLFARNDDYINPKSPLRVNIDLDSHMVKPLRGVDEQMLRTKIIQVFYGLGDEYKGKYHRELILDEEKLLLFHSDIVNASDVLPDILS